MNFNILSLFGQALISLLWMAERMGFVLVQDLEASSVLAEV
jgi:hypothetical protein